MSPIPLTIDSEFGYVVSACGLSWVAHFVLSSQADRVRARGD